MRKKNYIYTSLFLLLFQVLFSQASKITLEDCQHIASKNYPLVKQYNLIALTEKYTLDNLTKNYLPQVSFNGQATYQSEVIKFPFDFPGMNFPTMDKDQYKLTLDVSQTIWDGGVTHSQSIITKANTELEKQKVEVSLYQIRDRVNQLYFGILTVEAQLKQLEILNSNLKTNYDVANSLYKNGVAMASDLDLIKVELVNNEQKKIELQSMKSAYIKMLSLFIGQNLEETVQLDKPSTEYNFDGEITRPELNLYDKQRQLYNAKETSIKANNMPKFSLFAQGGYGKPGLNMLNPDFKTFAIGGIKLSWNFGNLYTKKNQEKQIEIDKSTVDVQKETFLFNTHLQLSQNKDEIQKYLKLMKKDEEIITLRQKVKNASENKYKNGVYQMKDLISDINEESQAYQVKSLHELQYLISIYNYKYTQGN